MVGLSFNTINHPVDSKDYGFFDINPKIYIALRISGSLGSHSGRIIFKSTLQGPRGQGPPNKMQKLGNEFSNGNIIKDHFSAGLSPSY